MDISKELTKAEYNKIPKFDKKSTIQEITKHKHDIKRSSKYQLVR